MEIWILSAYNETEQCEDIFGVFDSRESAEKGEQDLINAERDFSVSDIRISTMKMNQLYLG